jgi:hypothetical protein
MIRMAGATLALAMENAAERAKAEPAITPLTTEFVMEAQVTLEPAVKIGPSADGVRRYIPITGGTFHGPRMQGVVLPGGADWQVDRVDGVTELDALYSIRTNDGAVIMVRNRGLYVDGGAYFRTVPEFKAPKGPYDWLNKTVFVGSVAGAPRPNAVIVRVFRVL